MSRVSLNFMQETQLSLTNRATQDGLPGQNQDTIHERNGRTDTHPVSMTATF